MTCYYQIKSREDVFVNGEYSTTDWTKFDLKTADYIGFRGEFPKDYIVAMINPFK